VWGVGRQRPLASGMYARLEEPRPRRGPQQFGHYHAACPVRWDIYVEATAQLFRRAAVRLEGQPG
jgi:hypothetical protein